MENKKTSHLRRNIIMAVAALVIIAALVICFAPVMNKAYSVSMTELVQVSKPYTVDVIVPVQVSQPYTVDVTDQTQHQLSHQVTSATFTPDRTWAGLGPDCGMHFNVTVKNTDQQAGTFTVYFTYSSPSWVRHGEASVNVAPGEWQTAYYDAGLLPCNAITDWNYEVTTTSTHKETRYTTVTEYQTRQETRYRTVTEYQTRQETRYQRLSVLKYLTD